jgi:hypothetical protein
MFTARTASGADVAHDRQLPQGVGAPPSIVTANVFPDEMHRLDELAIPPAGWDTYEAQPITDTAIREARRFLSDLAGRFLSKTRIAKPYFIAPLSYGGVQMEWRRVDRAIEVEVGTDGTLGYLLITGQGSDRTFVEGDEVAFDDVLDLVTRLCNGE